MYRGTLKNLAQNNEDLRVGIVDKELARMTYLIRVSIGYPVNRKEQQDLPRLQNLKQTRLGAWCFVRGEDGNRKLKGILKTLKIIACI